MAPGSATFSLVVRPGGSVSLGGVVNTARAYSAAIDHDQTGNAATTTTAVIVPVAINVQPGAFPNNVSRRGQATVAVLTTRVGEYGLPLAIDATTIDPLSVRFGSAAVVQSGGGATEVHGKGHLEDSYELDETTRDGDVDMVFHFRVSASGLTGASTEACVRGTFTSGSTFFGCDSVVIVP
jgi:hypothetical protein